MITQRMTLNNISTKYDWNRERVIIAPPGERKIVIGRNIIDWWSAEQRKIAGLSKIDEKELYIVHMLSRGVNPFDHPQKVAITLPVEMLNINLEDNQALLEWAKKYEVPDPIASGYYNHYGRFECETRIVYRLTTVEECRSRLSEVKLAATLLNAIAWQDDARIRRTIFFENDVLVSSISCPLINSHYDWLGEEGKYSHKREEHQENFASDSASTRFIAACVLLDLVNRGLELYRIPTHVGFTDITRKPPAMDFQEYASFGVTYMSFIWETIKKALCDKKKGRPGKNDPVLAWAYNNCVKCGKFFDTRPPEHRSTRRYCDTCEEDEKRRKNTELQREKRAEEKARSESVVE